MPKIVKTVRSNQNTSTNVESNPIAIEMLATSLAEAVGTNYKLITYDDNADHKDYLVEMTNIGYPGWGVLFTRMDTASNFNVALVTVSSDNAPDFTNTATLHQYFDSNFVFNVFPNCLTTCVIFMDDSKDTVLINMHPGGTETASDVTDVSQDTMCINIFFAKDTKNDVVCGQGWGHINKIRTLTSAMEGVIFPNTQHDIFQCQGLGNSLHLTKMINYLSPEYVEMKSACVSVVRPIVTDFHKQNASFYADGGRWASVGRCAPNPGVAHGFNLFEPFDPWVKY